MARKGSRRWRRYGMVTVGACVVGGTATGLGMGLGTGLGMSTSMGSVLWGKQASAAIGQPRAVQTGQPRAVTISSPRPFFVGLNGQGPSFSGSRVVWTASNGQGQTGSEIDRIYAYDLSTRRLSVPVRTRYGAAGFIGAYALAGDQLAYVDTDVAPGGIFSWRVSIADLRHGATTTIASSPRSRGVTSTIPPQIAFDGTHLLLLQTANVGVNGVNGVSGIESTVILFTPARHRQQVLEQAQGVSLGDPALAGATALWTTQTFGSHASSHLTAYDLTRHALRTLPVGNASEVAASGDLVVWKSGMPAARGHLVLYSLRRNRVLSTALAHTTAAAFPSIAPPLVSWTDATGASVHVYNLQTSRVIYNAPTARGRIYGLSATTSSATSWVYTVLAPDRGAARGYVVVHPVR